MSDTWEKFQAATLSLARSGSIKDRLTDAYRNHLASVDEDELPSEIRDDFRQFHCALTRERPLSRDEDAVRATVRKMSSDEADRVASNVVRMFCAIPRAQPSASTRTSSTAQILPLFLTDRA